MYKAEQIAEWFLFYNRFVTNMEDADPITNLKLQKLLYYAQGCYLGLRDKPLFNEKIKAWTHGPVVPEVYQKYKRNGSKGINYEDDFEIKIDTDTENILKQVYYEFGQYSAWGLRNMTHQEAPWKETAPNQEIKLETIKNYFKENYVEL